MNDSTIFTVIAFISIVFPVCAILVITLSLYKLRGMKIQNFQKSVIFLYLLIYIIQILQTSSEFFIGNNQKSSHPSYVMMKYAFYVPYNIRVALQWILIYLQVIFARELMLKIKTETPQETFLKLNKL